MGASISVRRRGRWAGGLRRALRTGRPPAKRPGGVDERKKATVTTIPPSSVAGCLWPVAFTRSVFSTITAELIGQPIRETRMQAETAIVQDIDGFCNPHRPHSAPGGKGPLACERQGA